MLFDVTPVADALKPFSDFNYCGIDITPLLLMSHPGNRNVRADALKFILREIEETLGAVIGLFEAVAAIRDKLQNFTAAVANALSPALALPAEILAFIFKLFAEDGDPTISPIAISHVCSKWRAVSLSLPSLWTRPKLPQKHKGIAEEFSRRSSPLPLHLSMRPLEWRPTEIEFSEEYAHRIQSLHLSAELSEDSLQSFSRCTPLLQLQDVSLDNEARYEHVHSALKTVRSLRLYGYPCTESREFVTMEHLTELGIGKVDVYAVHHTLTRICAPALERVVFEDILLDYQDWTDASDLDTEDFVIPHLSIRDCNAYAWSAFMHWPWPQLKSFSIEITDMGGPEVNILECFELMFDRCKQLESLIILTPALIVRYPLLLLGMGTVDDGSRYLPHLRRFRLGITPWEDESEDACALLVRVLRDRDKKLIPKLEQLEITRELVGDYQEDLYSLVNDLVLI